MLIHTDPQVIEGLRKRSRLRLPAAGDRHGKLVVGDEFGYIISRIPRLTVLCLCDCGRATHQYVQYLRTGRAKSCGCAAGDASRARAAAMPYKRTLDPLYWTWRGMKQRCEDRKSANYRHYGARGIKLCPEWREDFDAFREWVRDRYVPGLSIERDDTNGDYAPGNCRWATDKEQANNTRRNAHLTAFGETRTIAEWTADPRCAVGAYLLYSRREQGWDGEAALTTPKAQELGPRVTAFGEDKTLRLWAKDPRCAVSYKVLWQRLKQQQYASPEEAISAPPYQKHRQGLRTTSGR